MLYRSFGFSDTNPIVPSTLGDAPMREAYFTVPAANRPLIAPRAAALPTDSWWREINSGSSIFLSCGEAIDDPNSRRQRHARRREAESMPVLASEIRACRD